MEKEAVSSVCPDIIYHSLFPSLESIARVDSLGFGAHLYFCILGGVRHRISCRRAGRECGYYENAEG
jgi:hypothetical protein